MARTITHQPDKTKQGTAALVDSDVRLMTYTQAKNQSNNDYYEGFRSHVDTVNAYDVRAGFHPGMWARHMEVVLNKSGFQVESDCSNVHRLKAMQEEAKDRSCKKYMAYRFLLMANEERFDEMKKPWPSNGPWGRTPSPRPSRRRSR